MQYIHMPSVPDFSGQTLGARVEALEIEKESAYAYVCMYVLITQNIGSIKRCVQVYYLCISEMLCAYINFFSYFGCV